MKRYIEVQCYTGILDEETVLIAAFFYIMEPGKFGPEYLGVNTMAWIVPNPTLGDLEELVKQIADHNIELGERLARGII